MRKLMLTLATLGALLVAPVVAHAQAGFLIGLAAGGLLFGGESQYGGGGATIMWSADAETLKKIDPLSVKLIASHGCFNNYYHGDTTTFTLGELFSKLLSGREYPNKDRTILQIVRVYNPSNAACASIWYAYIEK